MTGPLDFDRRTPLRRRLQDLQADWRALPDAAIGSVRAPNGLARDLVIADLTALPRLGFKGKGTIDAMKKRDVVVDAVPNCAFRQPDGGLCLVLAPGEVILLSNLNGEGTKFDALLSTWKLEDEERTYPLLRRDSHAWFAITGPRAPAMFAKICAIDLRTDRFPDLSIAQTSVAKMSAIVTRADNGDRPVYHVLADSAAALYFWDCLMDAGQEYAIRVAGPTALQTRTSDDETAFSENS